MMKQYVTTLLPYKAPPSYLPRHVLAPLPIRVPRGPLHDPPYHPPPYTSLFEDVLTAVCDITAATHIAHNAEFSQRLKQGQMPPHQGALTRPTPVTPPESYNGKLIDIVS